TPLTIGQELTILGVAMLTSKGASGVTGAGFVTLAATLTIIPDIPIQALAILVGIDKFMSECRALTNLIGNGVATVVISRWERELDTRELHVAMRHPVELGEALEREPLGAGHRRELDEILRGDVDACLVRLQIGRLAGTVLVRPCDERPRESLALGGLQVRVMRRHHQHLDGREAEHSAGREISLRRRLVRASRLGAENAVPRQAGALRHVYHQ